MALAFSGPDALKGVEARALLRAAGKPLSGDKSELIQRWKAHAALFADQTPPQAAMPPGATAGACQPMLVNLQSPHRAPMAGFNGLPQPGAQCMPVNVALGGSQQVIDSSGNFGRVVQGNNTQQCVSSGGASGQCLVAFPCFQQQMHNSNIGTQGGGGATQLTLNGNLACGSLDGATSFVVPGCSVPTMVGESTQGMALVRAPGEANGQFNVTTLNPQNANNCAPQRNFDVQQLAQ